MEANATQHTPIAHTHPRVGEPLNGDRPSLAIKRGPRHRAAKAGLDIVVLGVAAVAVGWDSSGLPWAALAVGLCLGVLAMAGQYRAHGPPLGEDLRTAAAASAIATMGAGAASAVVDMAPDTGTLATFWVVTLGALAALRATLAWLRARRWLEGVGTRRVLIIGAGQVSRLAARRLAARPGLGLQPVGFLDLKPLDGAQHDPEVLGASWDLERVVRDHQIDTVLVGFSSAPHHVLLRTIYRCWALDTEVMLVPRLYEVQGVRSRTQHVGGLPLVSLEPSVSDGLSSYLKAAFDRVAASLILVVLAPVLLGLTLAVKLTSAGPALYRAPRLGKDGKAFEMLKFRTMVSEPAVRGEADADWAAETLRSDAAAGDIRILARSPAEEDLHTPIGWMLRRTALDELPQLWNVVRGDMSLVGPRPERVTYAQLFSTQIYRYEARHRVRPGMTGWAQVQGLRGKTSLVDRVEWDNFYIENWSFAFDLKIVALTFVALWRA